MHKRKHTKLVHEGKYVAEVEVEIIDRGKWGQASKWGQARFSKKD